MIILSSIRKNLIKFPSLISFFFWCKFWLLSNGRRFFGGSKLKNKSESVCLTGQMWKYSVEKIFSVKVNSVNVIKIKGKSKRFKGIMGKRNNIKKAIVTLQSGNTIDLSAGV